MLRKILYLLGGLLLAFFLFVNLVNAPHKGETDQLNRRKGDCIIAALRAYQRDHGRYPETLDALAPDYLKAVPQRVIRPGETTGRPFDYEIAKEGKEFKIGYMEAAIGMLPSDSESIFDSSTGEWKTIQY